MQTVIGKVKSLIGKFLAKAGDGTLRELGIGDPIYEGDAVFADPGHHISDGEKPDLRVSLMRGGEVTISDSGHFLFETAALAGDLFAEGGESSEARGGYPGNPDSERPEDTSEHPLAATPATPANQVRQGNPPDSVNLSSVEQQTPTIDFPESSEGNKHLLGETLPEEFSSTEELLTGHRPPIQISLPPITNTAPVPADPILHRPEGPIITATPAFVPSPQNSAPVTYSTVIEVIEATGPTELGLTNPSDIDEDLLTITVSRVPIHGMVTRADGTVVAVGETLTPEELTTLKFTPDPAYEPDGTKDHFSYTVFDGIESSAGGAEITFIPINDAPSANPDAGAVTVGHPPASGNVLTSNDTDAESDLLTVISVNGSPEQVGKPIPGRVGVLVLGPNGAYSFTPGPEAEKLAIGETVVETFTYAISDGHGGSSATTLAITVTGTNNQPALTVGVGDNTTTGLSEINDLAPGENTVVHAASGTITLVDVDASDVHAVNVTSGDAGYFGTLTASVNDPATGDGIGTIGWSFTLPDAAIDFLGAGEARIQTYTIQVSDGQGGAASEVVSITLSGTNDSPIITVHTGSGDRADALATEIADGGTGINSQVHMQAGTLSFSDVDLTDIHEVTVSPGSSDYLGTLTAAKTDDSTGDGDGSIGWSFSVPDTAIEFLGAGETLTQTYTVLVADGKGGSASQVVTITLAGTNNPPSAIPDVNGADVVSEAGVNPGTTSFPGEVATTGNALLNDTDLDDSAALAIVAVNGVTGNVGTTVPGRYGSIILGSDGVYIYTLDNLNPDTNALIQGQTVVDSFTYAVMDEHGAISSTTLTITITGTNDVPVVTNDGMEVVGTVVENGSLDDGSVSTGVSTVGGTLTASDVDANATQTWSLVGEPDPTYGSVTLDPVTGAWSYTLNNSLTAAETLAEGQSVTQTFTARVTDDFGAYVDQTITVTITGTNDAPRLTADVNADDAVIESGRHPGNNAFPGDDQATGNVLNNDVDVDAGAILSVQAVNGDPANVGAGVTGTYGTVTMLADGSYTYVLNNADPESDSLAQGQIVTDSFTYSVIDELGAMMSSTLMITITGTNDVPVVTNAETAIVGSVAEAGSLDDGTVAAGTTSVNGTLIATDVDADATLTWSLQGSPSTTYGTISIDEDTGVWTYLLNNSLAATQALKEGQTVTQTYTARVTDDLGACVDQTITVTITGTNDVPVVTNAGTAVVGSVGETGNLDDGSVVVGTASVSGTLTASDVDADATQTWSLQGLPSTTYGTMVIDANTGLWTYTLNNSLAATEALKEGQVVTQTYTARVTDDTGAYVDQTITVTISGTNDVPVVTNVGMELAGSIVEAGSLDDGTVVVGMASVSGTLTTTDADADAMQTWSLQGAPSTIFGTMEIDANTGVWTYTLNNSLAATETLKEGQIVTQTYTARVTDDMGAYVDQTITITITGTNDVPVVTNAGTAIVGSVAEAGSLDDGTGAGGAASVSGTLTAADVDADASQTWNLQGSSSTTYGTMAIDADTGVWTYSLNNSLAATEGLKEGQTVTQTYTARVTDDKGAFVDQTITITITGTNDLPVVTNAGTALVGSVAEAGSQDDGAVVGGTASVSGTLTAADVDADATQTWSLQGSPSTTYGTIAIDAATGVWAYTLNNSLAATEALKEGQTVTQTYTARVTDDKGAFVDQTITITITGTNDVPVVTNAGTAIIGSVTEAGSLDDGSVFAGTTSASGILTATDVDADASKTWSLQGSPSTTYGTIALDPVTGAWVYSLNNGLAATQALKEGQTVTQIYTARVTDDKDAYVDQTISITITGTNDVPVVTNAGTAIVGSVTEAGHLDDGSVVAGSAAVSGTLTSTDADAGATKTWSIQGTSSTTYGTMAINPATGVWTYTLNNGLEATQALKEGQIVTETYTARVTDEFGAYVDQNITVSINGTNDAPTVVANTNGADIVSESGVNPGNTAFAGDTLATGNVLSNDIDVDAGATISVQAVNGVQGNVGAAVTGVYGSLILDANGDYTYTLNNADSDTKALAQGQTVTDTFSYTVVDELGAISTTNLTVTISGTNDVPVAAVDSGAVTENTTLTVNAASGLLTNDTDVDSETTLTVSSITNGTSTSAVAAGTPGTIVTTYGTLTVNANGSYSFVANGAGSEALARDQVTTDSFTCTTQDDHGATHTATLTITITGTNDAPAVVADVNGADLVTETGVNPGNTAFAGDAAAAGNVLANDDDVDAGASISVQAVNGASGNIGAVVAGTYGSVVIGADGSYVYSLNNADADTNALKQGQVVTDIFSYTVVDELGATSTSTLTITITGTNDIPVAVANTGAATENVTLTVNVASGLLANDTDVDNTPTLSVSSITNGTNTSAVTADVPGTITTTYGLLTINSNGSYTFAPNGAASEALAMDQTAIDSFTYTLKDDFGATHTATLTITITGTNDAPVAVADANGADVVTEAGVNPGTTPFAGDDAATGNVLSNDTDVDAGATKSVLAVTGAPGNVGVPVTGVYGTVTIDADGHYTYTLNNSDTDTNALAQGQVVTDTFSYTVVDELGATGIGTLTITITGTNDIPVATADTAVAIEAVGVSHTGGSAGTGNVLTNDVSVDTTDGKTVTQFALGGAPVAAGGSITGLYGTLSLAANGSYTYNIDNTNSTVQELRTSGQTLTEVFTYSMVDPFGASSSSTLTVTVQGANDKPIGVNDTGSAIEKGGTSNGTAGSDAVGNVLSNDTDVEVNGETKSVSAFRTGTEAGSGTAGTVGNALVGQYGSLTLNADGSYTYVVNDSHAAVQALATGGTLSEAFTYTVRDTAGATDNAQLTLTINGRNDAPVATNVSSEGNKDAPNIPITLTSTDVDAGASVSEFKILSLPTDGILFKDAACTPGQEVALNELIAATGSTLTLYFKPDYHATVGTHSYGPDWYNPGSPTVSFTFQARDADLANGVEFSNTGTATITVDDIAHPNPGAAVSVTENLIGQSSRAVSGNLFTDGAGFAGGDDYLGTDGANVYQIKIDTGGGYGATVLLTSGTPASGGYRFDTALGSLLVKTTGEYTFTPLDSLSNPTGADLPFKFSYSLMDGDGDVSGFVEQQITILDGEAPSLGVPAMVTVSEASLPAGTVPNPGALSQTGTLAVTQGTDGTVVKFDAVQTALADLMTGDVASRLSSRGNHLSYTVSADGYTLTVTDDSTTQTVFTVVINNPALASAGYTITLQQPLDHKPGLLAELGGNLDLPFTITITDDDQPLVDKATGTFTVRITDDASAAQTMNATEDTPITINTNADATGTNTSITGAAAHGSATVISGGANDGKITYTPDANFSGQDTFTYQTAVDGGGTQSITTTMNVASVADGATLAANKTINTSEDSSVALNLVVPTVNDGTDQNGATTGDNPERLGLINITGIPTGALIKNGGVTIFTGDGSTLRIHLTDGIHPTNLNTTGAVGLTTAEFTALTFVPSPNSGVDATLTVSTTTYEVTDAGAIVGAASSSTSQTISVDVQAVTDAVGIGKTGDASGVEDTWIRIDDKFTNTLNDTDGSQTFEYTFDGADIPAGWQYRVNGGAAQSAVGGFSVAFSGLTSPTIELKAPGQSSVDISALTVTIHALDHDGDSVGVIAETTATVDIGVIVASDPDIPTALAAGAGSFLTNEDTEVALTGFQATFADNDGSELHTFIIRNVPTGAGFSNAGGPVGLDNGDGTWTFTQGQLAGLTFTPSLNQSGTITMELCARTVEQDTLAAAEAVISFTVAVAPIADGALIAPQPGTGLVDEPIPAFLQASLQEGQAGFPTDELYKVVLDLGGRPVDLYYQEGGQFVEVQDTDANVATFTAEKLTQAQLDTLHVGLVDHQTGAQVFDVHLSSQEIDGSGTVLDTSAAVDGAITLTANDATGAANIDGSGADDSLYGHAGDSVVHGLDGNDFIDGGAGIDQLFGDTGNDTIRFDPADGTLDGGTGLDTMILARGTNIDFDSLMGGEISNIENIDLHPGGNHTLDQLKLSDLLSLTADPDNPTNHALKILGDAGDTVNLKNTATEQWQNAGSVVEDGQTFVVFHGVIDGGEDPTLTLKLDSQINYTLL